ncbi:MAG: putative methyltransferase, partial [Gemmatimonadota bacterium]|nr:putative methyltransferase [Gemmatimonadota bacterium]
MASQARLAEGAEGVRRILRTVFMAEEIPVRNVAQEVGLPVPVVAAVRGELEKRGILTRIGGVS